MIPPLLPESFFRKPSPFSGNPSIRLQVVPAGVASAAAIDTTISEQYLLIARDLIQGGTDVQTNNSEVGSNKAPVPASSAFPGGPSILGAVPTPPPTIEASDDAVPAVH